MSVIGTKTATAHRYDCTRCGDTLFAEPDQRDAALRAHKKTCTPRPAQQPDDLHVCSSPFDRRTYTGRRNLEALSKQMFAEKQAQGGKP